MFPYQYSDMGAMRLPGMHVPLFDLILYVNDKIEDLNKKNKTDYPLVKLRDFYIQSCSATEIPDLLEQKKPTTTGHVSYYRRADDAIANAKHFDLSDDDLEAKGYTKSDIYFKNQL